ncbi:hypothetical protein MJ257_02140 [Paenibacillus timonensis]|uniref:DUF6550 family protein n=1 Tax=Paenibacillus timonensis TaxID=225915 RepID=A0ABW3S7U2_9BACL|nr:DUF6550 family protein [Paenibacillus timonensis]MCH1638895.1 hypothetical protein [Paenibacillus timonensis]
MKKKSLLLVSGIVIVVALGGWTIWNGVSQQNGDEIQPDPVVTPATSTTPAVKAPEISTSPVTPSEHPGVNSEHPNSSSAPAVASETKPQPQLTPSETPVLQPEKEKKHVEVPLTKPEKTTQPTEPPKPKVKEPEKEQSPAAPPEYEEKETQPNKETATTPKAGAKNSKGQVYVPGFGWVEDQGGGTQETVVGKEGDELTGNKVGTMD